MDPILVPILGTLIVFGSITLMVKWTFDYFRDKNKIPVNERSLPVSELQLIIEQAVEEGTRPLRERVDYLERRLDDLKARPELEPHEERSRQLPSSESTETTSSTDNA